MPRGSKKFADDIIYDNATSKKVYERWLTPTEGTDGDERWVSLPGKGFFHAKKYAGQWYYRSYTPKALRDDVVASVSHSTSYTSANILAATISTLTVTTSSNLQTSTTISGDIYVQNSAIKAWDCLNTSNLKINSSDDFDTIQDIGLASAVVHGSLIVDSAGAGTGILGSSFLTPATHTSNTEHSTTAFMNKVLKLYDASGDYNATGAGTLGGSNADATVNAGGYPLKLQMLTRNEVVQLENIGTTTISSGQWGYVGAMNQDVHTATDPVQFTSLKLQSADLGANDWFKLSVENDGDVTAELGTTGANLIWDADMDHVGSGYVSGWASGNTWSLYEEDNRHKFEIDDLYVRGTLSVYELLVQQIRATNGSVFITSAAKIAAGGLSHSFFTGIYYLTFEAADTADDDTTPKPHPFADGDLLLSQRVDLDNPQNLVSLTRWTVIDASYGTADRLKATNQEFSVGDASLPTIGTTSNDIDGYDLVRVGNITDTDRQGSVYLTSDDSQAPFIDVIDSVSSWDEWNGVTDAGIVSNGNFDDSTGLLDNGTVYDSGLPGWTISEAGTNGGILSKDDGGINNSAHVIIKRGDTGSATHIDMAFALGTFYEDVEYEISWYGKKGTSPTATMQIGGVDNYLDSNGDWGSSPGGGFTHYPDWSLFTTPANNFVTEWKKFKRTFTANATLEGQASTLKFFVTGDALTTVHIDNVSIRPLSKIKARIGKLDGVGYSGYGLWAENAFLEGEVRASSGYIGDEGTGWNIDSTGLSNNSTSSSIKIANTSGFSGGGVFLDGAANGRFSLGSTVDESTDGLSYTGGVLTISGIIHIQGDSTGLPEEPVAVELYSSAGTNMHIGSEVAPSSEGWIQIGVWSDTTNTFDVSFKSQSTSSIAATKVIIDGLAVGTLAVVVGARAASWFQEMYDEGAYSGLQTLGITTEQIGLCGVEGDYRPFIFIGRKQAVAHSGGTFQLGSIDTSATDNGSLTTNIIIHDNNVTLSDSTGQIDDGDVFTTAKFSYESTAGFNFKPPSTGNVLRSQKIFVMPMILSGEQDDVLLRIVATDLSNGGDNVTTSMKVNGLLVAISTLGAGFNVEDFNPYSGIWNLSGNQIIEFFVQSTANATTMMKIHRISIIDKRTGFTYQNSALPASSTIANEGLYFSNDKLGYYDGVDTWAVDIRNDGNFKFGTGNDTLDFGITTADVLTLKGKMVAGSVTSSDGYTNFDLDNSKLYIKMSGNDSEQIVIGDNITDSANHDIILGRWQNQTNNSEAGQGILIKHTNNDDYTTINIDGLHRRSYPYPILIHSAFHQGWPGAYQDTGDHPAPNQGIGDDGTAVYTDCYVGYSNSQFLYPQDDNGDPLTETDLTIHGCNIAQHWDYDKTTVPPGRKLVWTFTPKAENKISSTGMTSPQDGENRHKAIQPQVEWAGDSWIFLHNAEDCFRSYEWQDSGGSPASDECLFWRQFFGINLTSSGVRRSDTMMYLLFQIQQTWGYYGYGRQVFFADIPAGTDVSKLYLIAAAAENDADGDNAPAARVLVGDLKIWETNE